MVIVELDKLLSWHPVAKGKAASVITVGQLSCGIMVTSCADPGGSRVRTTIEKLRDGSGDDMRCLNGNKTTYVQDAHPPSVAGWRQVCGKGCSESRCESEDSLPRGFVS